MTECSTGTQRHLVSARRLAEQGAGKEGQEIARKLWDDFMRKMSKHTPKRDGTAPSVNPIRSQLKGFSMKEWIRVLKAADAAARWHVHQRRKGAAQEPYINHLLEVATLVAEATAVRTRI